MRLARIKGGIGDQRSTLVPTDPVDLLPNQRVAVGNALVVKDAVHGAIVHQAADNWSAHPTKPRHN
jgi:hypothetical protein